ncbi:MAG: vitamin B12 dependent-methionine synthase activation domain-containing protein [Clostridiales bacterium]|nr:vitamin B12 dependent-methionine synthase activation domain-containing protein [Clostridiales bacterium]
MTDTLCVKTYSAPKFNTEDILRYAGVRGDGTEFDKILRECLDEARDVFTYRVCFREFPLVFESDRINLGFVKTPSADLRKNLSGCASVTIFAATVGLGIDRLTARYSSLSPVRALFFQAIGAERIESLCDAFNGELSASKSALGHGTRPRFSPGYGDLPLGLQKDILRVLDCQRKLGLSLNESLMMSPSKSVTAIVGVT